MEVYGSLGIGTLSAGSLVLCAYMYWRYVWFFRNPNRSIPVGENIVSPADGTVVYAKKVSPNEEVISIKGSRPIQIKDIVKEDVQKEKVLVGIFMSPFDVHFNRAPAAGKIAFVKHYEPVYKNYHMHSMHWRTIVNRLPIYAHSKHILSNERTVTKISSSFAGRPTSLYVVQIAGGSVRGIESYVEEGQHIEKGAIFGMIRIGSQVDLVMTWHSSMRLKVRPGEKVRAGETILLE